ncbi:MAG TPA: hydroxysqualene dehydroxylase HpnE [Chloroflexota bacterium]|nr:hydroxysqualene dehydroxylase HpnE [Chloroflexota bacterium]
MAAGQVAVVGGGLAGLSAAVELQRLGVEAEVFERGRLLGGKVTSYQVGDTEIDNGQHVYLGCFTEFRDFVASVGLSARLRLQERFEVLLLRRGAEPCWLRAAHWPAPWHLLPALVAHRHLDWPAKLQVAWAIARARQGAPAPGTCADWLACHHQGEAARRYFWEPFLVPALNAPLEAAAADAARFVIATAFAGSRQSACVGFADVPLARIAEAAAKHIGRVYCRTPVAGVWEEDGRVRGLRLTDGRELPYDAVVLAVPPRQLGRLLGDPARCGVAGLEAFQPQPIVDVHLWFDRADLEFEFAAVLDSPVQWVFQKAPGYLCCSLSAAHDLVTRPEAELVALCRREVSAALPALAAVPLSRAMATRDPEATYAPTPGLRRPGPATRYPNLAIAGAWTDTGWLATMESAVRSGRAAARWITAGGARHAA